jgi:(R,R)-butanediol dehydrogenase / meso-butanediol dehydrogenase / diacetyl reductase
MRAALFHGNHDLRIEEVPAPLVGPGDLLLRVAAAGICGTDAHEYAAGPRMFPIERRDPRTGHVGPMIPGHEIAGIVEAIGEGVDGFAPGILVVTGAGISCGVCARCREGRTNLCERYATVGLQRHGGLAQFVVVPAATCVAAPSELTPDAAALGQPMAIGVHSMRQGSPRPGELALVIGVGGIGAFLTYALSATGVRTVAADLDDERLAIGRALGADLTLGPKDAPIAEVVRERIGEPDVVYEVTGTVAGLDAALSAVRPGGRVVAVGLHEHLREIDLRSLTLRELSIHGTNAHVVGADLPEALRLLAARHEPWSDVAPTALSLDRLVPDGLEPLAEGRSRRIKTLVDPWSEVSRPTRMVLEEEHADAV